MTKNLTESAQPINRTLDLPTIQKQIHFFLLAALADATAFSVCCSLPGFSDYFLYADLPSLHVVIYALRLLLDVCDCLILLLHKHRHLLEHLSKLCEGPLDLLNLGMSFLHFTIGSARCAIPV